MKKLAIGLDFGGTWIEAGIVNERGKIITEIHQPTKANLGKKATISKLESVISDLLMQGDNKRIIGIGIGSPGPINFDKGLVKDPPNLPGWHNVLLKNILAKKLKIPVFLDNDANAALLGELWKGRAQGKKNVILLTLGTGIGGAAIINGQIYRGRTGGGAEFGHMIIDKNFPQKSTCGHYGCLESFTSSKSIINKLKKETVGGRRSLLTKSKNIDSLTIYQAALKGDRLSIEVLENAGENLGVGIINLINIFEPELVILSGQLSKAKKYFWSAMQKEVKNSCFKRVIPIVKARLGDEAGIIGAASLVFKH